jgi:hypothetical protein
MKYLDNLSLSFASGLSLIGAGIIGKDYLVTGIGLGLATSSIGGLIITNDDYYDFEEVREEFNRREKLVQKLYKKD